MIYIYTHIITYLWNDIYIYTYIYEHNYMYIYIHRNNAIYIMPYIYIHMYWCFYIYIYIQWYVYTYYIYIWCCMYHGIYINDYIWSVVDNYSSFSYLYISTYHIWISMEMSVKYLSDFKRYIWIYTWDMMEIWLNMPSGHLR